MTDAPERIWLDWPAANRGDPVYDQPPERDTQPGQTGYVRADIHATKIAVLEADAAAARKRVQALISDFNRQVDLECELRAAYEKRMQEMEADHAAEVEALRAERDTWKRIAGGMENMAKTYSAALADMAGAFDKEQTEAKS